MRSISCVGGAFKTDAGGVALDGEESRGLQLFAALT